MQKNKIFIAVLAASLLTGALVGCGGKKGNSNLGSSENSFTSNGSSTEGSNSLSSVFDPDDPKNSTSAGSIVRDSDFSRALEFKYNSYTLTYDQLYNNESVEEFGYIYYVNSVSYVLDYSYVETTGQFDYLYYATYENDGYMYWQKADGYEYDGWVANGYHDADLAMYNAYFDFERFISILTPEDVEYILGAFYVKESSMKKFAGQGLEFFGDPFYGAVEKITTIGFLTDKETGAITKIMGACDEKSDNGFIVQLDAINDTRVPQNAITVKAPYYNSDSDRNIYTYAEMKGASYVPDVWPTGVTLTTVGDVEKEEGYDAVIDIAESVEVAYSILPENVNRIEFDWVSSDETVVDLDYKYNFTAHHKYATGIKEGDAYVSIKLQKQDGTWLESNKLKIKVKPLASQDKTNAVYDLTITGSSYAKNGEEVDKNTTIFSAYNAVNTTAQFNIKGHNAQAFEAKNADAFGDTGMVMVVSPAAQEYMNNGFYSEVTFDFGDQEVVSLNFYYALYKANQRGGALSNLSEAYIQTSSDGINWSEKIDIKEEMQHNFSNVNLDYEAQQKLMTRSFAKASKVKLYFKASMVGNNYWIAMNNFVFSNDETCHNHNSNVIEVTKVNATASANKVKVGDSIQFGATVEPSDATYQQVTWVVSDPTKAAINAMGSLTAIAEGTVEVYAVAHNGVQSEKITITIIGQEYLDSKYVGNRYLSSDVYENSSWWEVEFEVLSTSTAKLTLNNKKGTEEVINFTYYTKDNSTRPLHTFKGENNEVLDLKFYDAKVEVFLSGSSVLSLGNTHTNNGEELALFVAASSIRLTHNSNPVTSATFKVGETYTFYYAVNPSNAYNKTCTAVSSDTTVVTVANTEYGSGFVLTGVAAGTATITVKNVDNVEATLSVTVEAVVTLATLTASATKTTLEVGETTTATASFTPANANSYNLSWSTSSSSIVSISGKGNSVTLTAKSAGSAVITVTDSVTNKTATITITVNGTSAGNVPAQYVGKWVGETDEGCTFWFQVNANGTAKLTVFDYDMFVDAEFDFTVMSEKYDGNDICFECNDNPDIKLGIFGTSSLYVYDDGFDLGICYGDYLEISKQ